MAPPLSFDDATTVVDEPAWYEAWRADFERSAPFVELEEVRVPSGEALRRRCESYRFPARATDALLAERPQWNDPRLERLGAHVQWLIDERYAPATYIGLGWPPPPTACRLFYAFAALGLAVRTEAAHRLLGIAPAVSMATLWDLGQQIALHVSNHGAPGMHKAWWLSHHLASHLFRLGRLQFQRSWAGADHGPVPPGAAFLDVHIPEDGPLGPAACDESFRAAPAFFARHFPNDGGAWFSCASWLLDPQLAEILPERSNIVRFQRRFELVHVEEELPSFVFEFVFHRPDLDRAESPDLDELPRRTGLERALLDLYERGGRIRPTLGVIRIRP